MSTLTDQQKLASGLDNHILVTANAGSGKTKVLAGRFVDALLHENVKVNELAAITFTDKAASELYAKIRSELIAIYEITNDPKLKVRINNIIRDLINSNISTIHSFCSGILKEYAVEAGIDPGFTLIDEKSAKNLLSDSIEKVISDSLADPILNPTIKKAIRLFKSMGNFKNAHSEMISNRKRMNTWLGNFSDELNSIDIYDYSLRKIEEYIKILFPTLADQIKKLEELNNYVLENSKSELAQLASAHLSKYYDSDSFLEKYIHLSNFLHATNTKAGKLGIANYLTKKLSAALPHEDLEEYQNINDNLTPFFHSEVGIDFEVEHNLMLRFAEYSCLLTKIYWMVFDLYNNEKKRINCIDFEDMLIFTAELLKKESIRKSVTGRFKYIMIDEYQDTNDLQFAIFLPILGDLSTGNLYVVGDRKQSIYGFRDADLNVFNKTAKKITDNSGNSVILEHTFRLSKQMTAFVNWIFPPIFATRNPIFDGSEDQFQKKRLLTSAVDYEDTTFFDINKPYTKSEIAFIINRETGTKTDGDKSTEKKENSLLSPIEKEAWLLVSHLVPHFEELRAFNATVKKDDKLTIAILTRQRKNFVYLEEALAEANIPYELMGGKRFYQHQVVQDISLIFKFIVDSDDDFILYSLLRSPFFSLSDEDLLELSQVPGKTGFEKIRLLALDSGNHYSQIFEILIELKNYSSEAKPFAIIDFMLSKTPYLAIVQNRRNGRQYLANIKKILSEAIEFESSTFNSIFDYNEYLSGLIALEEDETQAPLSLDEESVKIMTIHQAKGLEFTTVYLFACGTSAFKTAKQSDNTLSVNKDLGLIFQVPETEDIFYHNKEAILFKLGDYWRKQVDIEEIKRVLYVAITRAANNLYICSSVKDGKPSKYSYLEMILSGLNLEIMPEDEIPLFIKKMKFARNENGKIIEAEMDDFELNLKIISEPISNETVLETTPKTRIEREFNIHPQRIPKYFSNEIVTASKFITYLECPFKYYLNYISGVSTISNFENLIPQNQLPNPEEEYQVDDTALAIEEGYEPSSKRSNLGAVTGSIIHQYLAKMNSNHFEDQLLKGLIDDFYLNNLDIAIEKNVLLGLITGKLLKYLSSHSAIETGGFSNSRNEFEIFIRYDSFYLMGVIDKIIILEDRIIIIDYKTGKSLKHSMQRYSTQLDFYAFLCSRLYTEINEFELRLISIDNPDSSSTRIVTRNSIIQIEEQLNNFVFTLRSTISNSGFFRNIDHCHICKFSNHNNECFVP